MQALETILRQQRGVVRRSVAIDYLGRPTVRWRVESGKWQNPLPGVLVTHSGPLDEEQRLWVALLGAGRNAVLAGLTAAIKDGLKGFTPESTYVLVPPGRKLLPRPGLVIHRSQFMGDADVHPVRLPRRTRLPRSIVDAAAWMPTDSGARAVVAAGVQQRLVRVEDLRRVLARLTTIHRRKLLRRTLDDVAGGARALSELDFVRLLRRYGLPVPDRQVVRRDERGRRRWVDAYFDKWRLVVEIDGMWHMQASTWWSDMLRDNQIVIGGDRVLRFPSFVVREQPELVARQIAAALRALGWKGSCVLGL